MHSSLRLLVNLLVLSGFLCGLYALDLWLSEGALGGSRRGYNNNLLGRVAQKPDAEIAVIGQSTTTWLSHGALSKLLHLPEARILDAHIGGCDYTGNYAEVRHLLSEGRHYRKVFFGANLYQMCEDRRSWRVFTPLELMPTRELPQLFALWLHGIQPLEYYGRAVGMTVSEAYDDTLFVRNRLETFFGFPSPKPASQAALWADPTPKASDWSPTCSYEPKDVALKEEVVRQLMSSLKQLGDEVYYLALSDRSRSDPALAEAWTRFVTRQRQLTEEVGGIHFIDLTSGGATTRNAFRDGAHLNQRGEREQTILLQQKLRELGPDDLYNP